MISLPTIQPGGASQNALSKKQEWKASYWQALELWIAKQGLNVPLYENNGGIERISLDTYYII